MYRDCLLHRQKYKHIARNYGLVNNAAQFINKYYQRLDQSLDQSFQNTSPHIVSSSNPKLNENSFIKKILNDEEIK